MAHIDGTIELINRPSLRDIAKCIADEYGADEDAETLIDFVCHLLDEVGNIEVDIGVMSNICQKGI